MNRLLLLLCCICVPWMARGQAAYDWCYWFDHNHAARVSGQAFGNRFTIETDAIGLSEGFHTINMQVADSAGRYSSPLAKLFYYTKGRSQTHLHYWFDEDEQTRNTMPFMDKVMMIDVSDLQEGFHVLHIQIFDAAISDIITTMFIKVPQTEGVGDMTCICSVDGKLIAKETLPTAGGILKWDMDVDNMDVGIHKAMFQVITPSGAASSIAERYFVRAITNTEIGNMKCVYTIDDFDTYYQAGTLSDGLFHFDLDVASIENGLHHLSYTLVSETGITLPRQTAFFWKTPLGGEGIVQYDYWVNENDGQKHVVKLDQHTNPFSLITLLPVETQPIRSSNFQFAIKNGEPLIYARNDFHIQFFDTNGRMVEETKEYVDEQVSAAVEPVGELQETQTFDKVAENDIRWYTISAEKGERLEFKLDRAATLQVFSPSGKEVHNVYGSESVTWNGLNVEESGIFYVALHNVTATQSEIMNLDYKHIDRYAVLRQDVAVVGNRDYSTVTFFGNGFDELTEVCLIQGTDTICATEIGHENNVMTTVKFCFDDIALGQYKAVFHFANGIIVIENCITVKVATDISIDVATLFNKNNLISFHKTKYIFSVHNNGNVTAYDVPLMIRVYTHNAESLEKVYVEGYDLAAAYKNLLGEYYTDSLANVIEAKRAISGDRCFFLEADSTDIVGGWAAHVHQCFVLPTIPPNSTKDIVVSLELGQAVYCYMWHPEEWYDDMEEKENVKTRRMANSGRCGKTPFRHEYNCSQNAITRQSNENAELDFPYEDCSDYKPYPMPCPGDGGISSGVGSSDPNDIKGYVSASGSKFMPDSIQMLDYAIEFENDTTLANASAHIINIRDTLDAQFFDLKSFVPTAIKLGGHELTIDKVSDVTTENDKTSFVKTIDMRPKINAIAQVEGEYNQKKGIAEWRFTSLDPMTMESTDDFMAGILPMNHDGTSGVGRVCFDINLNKRFVDGTEVSNRASIVFDKNEAILTPTWTNIVDAVAPTSFIDEVVHENDSTISFRFYGVDNASGIWKYRFYVQAGQNAPWWEVATDIAPDSTFSYRYYDDIDYGFYVVAVDSAGNVEKKVIQRECSFKAHEGDYEVKIDELPASSTESKGDSYIYDLSGRRHDKPQEGVNIIDKKKVLFRRKGK